MHAALKDHLPASAYSWHAAVVTPEAVVHSTVVVHPQPLNKARFHGSLLQGIVRNLDFALRRWQFEHALVLSSRSWFRRPLTVEELTTARASVPPGAKRAQLKVTAEGGTQFVDESERAIAPEVGPGTSGGLELRGYDWGPLLRTRLSQEMLGPNGHAVLNAPHEGLLLERAACELAVSALEGPIGAELYKTEAAVEEMAIHSLVYSRGLRWAQLSDMGPRGADDELSRLEASGPHVTPITKVERYDPSASTTTSST